MPDHVEDNVAFAASLRPYWQEVCLHSPQGVDDVAERLRSKLASRGITLTTDVPRALAFAILNGRNL